MAFITRTYRPFLLLSLVSWIALSTSWAKVPETHTISVDDAYRAIPHKRTQFSVSTAKIPTAVAKDLENYFNLVDRAIVIKVSATQKIAASKSPSQELDLYATLLGELALLQKKLNKDFVKLTHQAISEHREFFKSWIRDLEESRKPAATRILKDRLSHPLIRASSQKLIQSYQQLLTLYPDQPAKTKEAFFDHLCALDFI